MAEAWARTIHPDRIEPSSAGTRPGPLDSRAVDVMKEAGIDISSRRPKGVEAVAGIVFDCVITVCDDANESCPVSTGCRESSRSRRREES